jgi:hypothetical protein
VTQSQSRKEGSSEEMNPKKERKELNGEAKKGHGDGRVKIIVGQVTSQNGMARI